MSGKSFKVIVIGAGIAGITACQRLIESGVTDILLLEAGDRLGGRIHSIPYRKHLLIEV